MACKCDENRAPIDRNVPAEDLSRTAILSYEGNDAPFSIRGPHSKIVYNRIRRGWSMEVYLADARTLSQLVGFRIVE